jgi:hypothetical protein
MKQVLSVLALAATTGLAAPAFAQTYRALASGPAESPPNGSPGSSTAIIDIDSSKLMVDMSFQDLVGTASAAHIEIRGFLMAAPVPEPAEWGLMAGGLAGLLWMRRRKRWEVSWQR